MTTTPMITLALVADNRLTTADTRPMPITGHNVDFARQGGDAMTLQLSFEDITTPDQLPALTIDQQVGHVLRAQPLFQPDRKSVV